MKEWWHTATDRRCHPPYRYGAVPSIFMMFSAWEWFLGIGPIWQALLAGTLTWLLTALGALVVLFTGQVSRKFLDAMLGFAAGVMIAASVWSLLIPSIELSSQNGGIGWLPAVIGLLLGGAFLRLLDLYLPHLHRGLPRTSAEGLSTAWRRATLLILAITLHNIPEGLAVGVAFGAAADAAAPGAAGNSLFAGAVTLAIGIGLQNVPEGMAVAVPLRREGLSRGRSLWYGQLSALVEPLAAVAGAAAVQFIGALLPYALAFAAGAMIFVAVEELIPESHQSGHGDIATMGTMLGFALMMTLDVALG